MSNQDVLFGVYKKFIKDKEDLEGIKTFLQSNQSLLNTTFTKETPSQLGFIPTKKICTGTLLHFAVLNGCDSIYEFLLSHPMIDPDIKLKDRENLIPTCYDGLTAKEVRDLRKAKAKNKGTNINSQSKEVITKPASFLKSAWERFVEREPINVSEATFLKLLPSKSEKPSEDLKGSLLQVVQEKSNEAINITQTLQTIKENEFAAIYLYTCEWTGCTSIYKLLNTELTASTRHEGLSKWKPYLWYILTDFQKIPKQNITTPLFRGVPLDIASKYAEKYKEGAMITWYAFTSTTMVEAKVTGFLKKDNKIGERGTLFIIMKALTGRCIKEYSSFPDEYEVLFCPGSRFIVQKIEKGDEITNIFLEEIPQEHLLKLNWDI